MLKKISAMKARQNLGQLLNEVSIRGDSYIIERAGKPLAVLVDMERFQLLQEDQSFALQALKKVWEKMAGADPQEIQEAIGRGQEDVASRVAEQRLGMSSLGLHGAQEAAKHMPQGMKDAGTEMHHSASRFAVAVQNAGVTGDLKPAIEALAKVTAACVACHASYRLQ